VETLITHLLFYSHVLFSPFLPHNLIQALSTLHHIVLYSDWCVNLICEKPTTTVHIETREYATIEELLTRWTSTQFSTATLPLMDKENNHQIRIMKSSQTWPARRQILRQTNVEHGFLLVSGHPNVHRILRSIFIVQSTCQSYPSEKRQCHIDIRNKTMNKQQNVLP